MNFNSVIVLVSSNEIWYVVFVLFPKLHVIKIVISTYYLKAIEGGYDIILFFLVFFFVCFNRALIVAFCCLFGANFQVFEYIFSELKLLLIIYIITREVSLYHIMFEGVCWDFWLRLRDWMDAGKEITYTIHCLINRYLLNQPNSLYNLNSLYIFTVSKRMSGNIKVT